MTNTPIYNFDPHYRYNQIVVVGLGGTGSHVARCLARLLYHHQQKGQRVPEVLFVDPDIIESKNVGRQLFAPSEINETKAAVLARRYNYTFGLSISAACEPLDASKHIQPGAIVCGCVDNHAARAEIARAQNCTWIDGGNEYDFGQVVIGNSGSREQVLDGLRQAQQGECRYLPHAGLLFPALLQPEVEAPSVPAMSCAERTMRDEQQLFVNDFIGNILAQYVYRLLNREPVTTFATFLNLTPAPLIRSISITQADLEVYLDAA